MKSKTVAIIPIRKNSQRIKNKNFINFYKGKSLLELKIEQLKKVNEIDEIVVSSDSLKAKKSLTSIKFHFKKEINIMQVQNVQEGFFSTFGFNCSWRLPNVLSLYISDNKDSDI